MCRVAVSIALPSVLAMPPVLVQFLGPHAPKRKVLMQIPAEYPASAKRVRLAGIVNLDVGVRPNGQIQSSGVIGGCRLLIGTIVAAEGALKFGATQHSATETMLVHFKQP